MLDITNKTLEDAQFSEKNGNFQTTNMIYKLKKIKKKRKQPENIKNIPFPEVLSNLVPTLSGQGTDSGTNQSSVQEGFKQFKFEYDDWDGHDNIKDEGDDLNGKDPRQVIVDFINKLYNSTVYYNHWLAGFITEKISTNKAVKQVEKDTKNELASLVNQAEKVTGNSITSGNTITSAAAIINSNKDQGLNVSSDEAKVYDYLCIFEALVFSSFVVNNWYFLMFYNNFDNDNEFIDNFDQENRSSGGKIAKYNKLPLPRFSPSYIKSLDDSNSLSIRFLKNGVMYFFEYALYFPTFLQWVLLVFIPPLAVNTLQLNHILCFMLLFVAIFLCSYYLVSILKDFIIACIWSDFKNIPVILLYTAVIVLFLIPDSNSSSSIFNHEATKQHDLKSIEKTEGKISELTNKMNDANTSVEQKEKYRQELEALNEKLTLKKGHVNYRYDLEGAKIQPDTIREQAANKIKNTATGIASGVKNTAVGLATGTRDAAGTVVKSFADTGTGIKNLIRPDRPTEMTGGADAEPQSTGKKTMYQRSMATMSDARKNLAPVSKRDAALTFLKIIWNILRFLVITTISVPFGGLFCFIYFVLYSLYGMLYCYNNNMAKISEAFHEMLKFIDEKKVDDVPSIDDSFFTKLVRLFYQALEYLSDNFFIIVFLIIFIYFFSDTYSNIKNLTLKNALCFFDLSFIFMILSYLYYVIKARFNIGSISDFVKVARGLQIPEEKNYDTSVSTFTGLSVLVYGLTILGIGYMVYLSGKGMMQSGNSMAGDLGSGLTSTMNTKPS